MRIHWQNLTRCHIEDPVKPIHVSKNILSSANRHKLKKMRIFPWNGRAWLPFFGWKETLGFEWNLKSNFFHIHLNFDKCESKIVFGIAIRPIAIWFSTEGFFDGLLKRLPGDRTIGISFYRNSIHWDFWYDKMGCTNPKKLPRYRNGSFDFPDFFLGKTKYSKILLEEKCLPIPMPEGVYDAIITLYYAIWKRPRWVSMRIKKANIDIIPKTGVPVPGKGTCSYNCGDDAIFSSCAPANSIPDAVGKFVGSILSTRIRYGGYHSYTWKKQEAMK